MRMASVAAIEAPEEPNDSASESPNARGLREQTVTGAFLEKAAFTGFVNYVLHFLSAASNEKLGACALALGLVTYFVLGRFGLVLIGMIGGIVLHATWETSAGFGVDERFKDKENSRRKEEGLDVIARVLNWRQSQGVSDKDADHGATNGDASGASERGEEMTDFRPATRAALSRLIDAVIRDYVQ